MTSRRRRVAVVGGGISGLATAHYLTRDTTSGVDVVVLEADRRLGGKLLTVDLDGIRIEAGADSFVVRKPWAIELCRELGLEDQLVVPAASGAYVMVGDALIPFPERSAFGVPSDTQTLARWPGLLPRTRMRALMDLLLPRRKEEGDESLAGLLRRRLGPAAEILVEPLLAGLHAGDTERLSVMATFPELQAWERQHGSLLRGARAALRAADRSDRPKEPLFATVWEGLGALVSRLHERIGGDRLRPDSPVAAITRDGDGYTVDAAGERLDCDAVVLATPAFESARLLSSIQPDAAEELAAIPYASTAVVLLVYPEGTGRALPETGTGFVVPSGQATISACTWMSRKWPHDAMGDRAVLRCFVGRAGDEAALDMADADLIATARADAEAIVEIGAAPRASKVIRWNRAMPQYEVGHLDRLARLDAALADAAGIFVTGSAYRGVGIADCVRQAQETAERVGAYLSTAEAPAATSDEREAVPWTN